MGPCASMEDPDGAPGSDQLRCGCHVASAQTDVFKKHVCGLGCRARERGRHLLPRFPNAHAGLRGTTLRQAARRPTRVPQHSGRHHCCLSGCGGTGAEPQTQAGTGRRGAGLLRLTPGLSPRWMASGEVGRGAARGPASPPPVPPPPRSHRVPTFSLQITSFEPARRKRCLGPFRSVSLGPRRETGVCGHVYICARMYVAWVHRPSPQTHTRAV